MPTVLPKALLPLLRDGCLQMLQSLQLYLHIPRSPSSIPGASSQKPWDAHLLQQQQQNRQHRSQACYAIFLEG
jgi:hypothetical protein